jgi:hypothetical protein
MFRGWAITWSYNYDFTIEVVEVEDPKLLYPTYAAALGQAIEHVRRDVAAQRRHLDAVDVKLQILSTEWAMLTPPKKPG